ncbi:UbiD family decarboxylase [Enterococcus gilvus]|uniref:UbiD family decarboxylase n=1 Tax=Enterococcus gilvus TaxID=160453 RepID=UPI003ED89F2D
MSEKKESFGLREALSILEDMPGQLHCTDEPVAASAEISGIYRYVGAGGTVKRPTKEGPAMIFNKIEGYPDTKVLIGLLASRKRVAAMLNQSPEHLGRFFADAVMNPIQPITVSKEEAQCQEVVHLASDPGFDLRKIVPAPTNTEEDAGPYITMGLVYGSDLETKESDITIHRLCVQGRDELTMYIVPGGRHLGAFFDKYENADKPMPVSISIGVDPAIEIGACFEPPTTPLGYNELAVAGSIRQQPVELVDCLTINEKAIANAEFVLEGELLPNVRVREDKNTNTGKAMPEFPGYTGPAQEEVPVIKIKAVTHRKNPILQTVIGPSEEHVNLAGIPTEASIIQMIDKAMPGRLQNVYSHPSGGGKYMAILQFKKGIPSDEGRQRQAALVAFSAFSELKHVILVDEDVDPFDSSDVMWAMNTRYQGDIDTVFIPGVRCHPLDPTQNLLYNPLLRDVGISCKVIFDCTVPYDQKDRFQRAKFKEMDYKKYLN